MMNLDPRYEWHPLFLQSFRDISEATESTRKIKLASFTSDATALFASFTAVMYLYPFRITMFVIVTRPEILADTDSG